MTTARDLLEEASGTIGRADAEFILMSLLGAGRHELYEDNPVPDGVAAGFRRLLPAAAAGTPPQYLVGSAPFLDFSVLVDPRVLIPRPETEGLVLKALERRPDPGLVLDYGTGSGCIAIAVARAVPAARVVAADVSEDALAVAAANVERHRLGDRIELVRAAGPADPAFDGLRGRVDLLLSNPPYVPTGRLPALEPRVRDHEPKSALDGGPNGTTILNMLLEQGTALLAPGGLLALEIDASHGERLRAAVPAARVEPDLAGLPRYLFLETGRRR